MSDPNGQQRKRQFVAQSDDDHHEFMSQANPTSSKQRGGGMQIQQSLHPAAQHQDSHDDSKDTLGSKAGDRDRDPQAKIAIRVLVDSAISGRLIGRGGATVKAVRDLSGAWIDIANSVRGATKRVVTVKGNVEGIINALCLMADCLAGLGPQGPAAQYIHHAHTPQGPSGSSGQRSATATQDSKPSQSASKSSKASASAGSSSSQADHSDSQRSPSGSDDSPPIVSIILLVHNAQVGCIIGKSGSSVRETREQSGCQVNVSEQMLEGSMEKTVSIKGSPSSLRKAVSIIVAQLAARQDRSSTHNLYTPRPAYDPYQDPYALSYSPYSFPGAQQPSPLLSSGLGQGVGVVGTMNSMSAAGVPGPSYSYGSVGGVGVGAQGLAAAAAAGSVQTIMVPVSEAVIGCVIGKRGVTIREIRQRSRAQITIADQTQDSHDRMITITGTRQQYELAVALVYDKIAQFDPNRRGRSGPSGGGAGPQTPGQHTPNQQAQASPSSDHQ